MFAVRTFQTPLRGLTCNRAGTRLSSASAAVTALSPAPEQAMQFALLLENLKVQKRTGWVRMDISEPESIADHMYRMGVMALVAAAASGLDVYRCMRIAITHDVAEAVVGDITPHCGVPKEEKQRLERQAIADIKQLLGGNSPAAIEVEELWEEYEAASTEAAVLVKDLDKLEMIIQAYEYEQKQGANLQEFFDSTQGKFKTPIGQQWAQELVQLREAARTPGAPQPKPSPILQFFMLLSNLKCSKRTGWLRMSVAGAESIADHMYRMAMLALVAGTLTNQDADRCVAMALVHDIAEAVVGDITPHCGVPKEEKQRMERQAIADIKQLLREYPETASLVEELWEEYEAASSEAAVLVKDLDKLEMIIQAHQYERRQGVDLQEFFTSTQGKFKTPLVRQWVEELVQLRHAAALRAFAVGVAV